MPRFVLLLHECPGDHPRPTHCDLMLEAAESLRTWSIASLPRDWTTLKASTLPFAESNTVSAEQIGDHRIAYLDCEGPVSGGRGSVRRLDVGTFTIRQQSPERWELDLEGQTRP